MLRAERWRLLAEMRTENAPFRTLERLAVAAGLIGLQVGSDAARQGDRICEATEGRPADGEHGPIAGLRRQAASLGPHP